MGWGAGGVKNGVSWADGLMAFLRKKAEWTAAFIPKPVLSEASSMRTVDPKRSQDAWFIQIRFLTEP